MAHGIGVAGGNGYFGQVRGNLFGLGIAFLDECVDVSSCIHFDDMSANHFAHLNKLCQRVGVGDGLYVG